MGCIPECATKTWVSAWHIICCYPWTASSLSSASASFSSSLCFLPAWILFTCCCKIAPQACCHPLEGNKSNFLKVRPVTSEFENLSHLFIEINEKKRGRTTKKKKIASGNKGQAKFVVLRNLRVWERKCKGWKKGGLWQKTRLAHCAACHGKSKDSNPSIDESVVITNVLKFYTRSGKLCIVRRRRRSRVQHDFVNVSSKNFHCLKTWLSRAIANLPHSSQDPRNFEPSKEDSEKKFASEEEDWENCIPCHNHSPKVPFFHKCPQEIHLIICIYLHRPIFLVCVQGNLQWRRRNAVTHNGAAVNIVLKQVLLQMCLWKNLFQRLYIVNNCSKV